MTVFGKYATCLTLDVEASGVGSGEVKDKAHLERLPSLLAVYSEEPLG